MELACLVCFLLGKKRLFWQALGVCERRSLQGSVNVLYREVINEGSQEFPSPFQDCQTGRNLKSQLVSREVGSHVITPLLGFSRSGDAFQTP